jgi:hypothetical protein
MNICFEIDTNNNILSGLSYTFKIMEMIESCEEEEFTIDCSKTKFVSPAFVLPLMILVKGSNKNISFTNLTSYLSTIHFGNGFCADNIRIQEFRAIMEEYKRKTYIPIINFPAIEIKDDLKNNILSAIENLLVKQTNIEKNIAIGLKYVIDEYVDNITQHSKSERGYIFAQAYPTKHYMDICIGDNGITLLGSYHNNGNENIKTDLDAMNAANNGISTKNLPNAENRGYGIFTSKKMLIDGLNGDFVMISGHSMYIYNSIIDKFLDLPKNISCPGTIVLFRIPYINTDFNYINYVE